MEAQAAPSSAGVRRAAGGMSGAQSARVGAGDFVLMRCDVATLRRLQAWIGLGVFPAVLPVQGSCAGVNEKVGLWQPQAGRETAVAVRGAGHILEQKFLPKLVHVFVSLKEMDLFFQAEGGIRDTSVTGVQTCALPILRAGMAEGTIERATDLARHAQRARTADVGNEHALGFNARSKPDQPFARAVLRNLLGDDLRRSEERRVGK